MANFAAMTIHREGYPSLIIAATFGVALYAAATFLLPTMGWVHTLAMALSFALFLVVLQFFRNPSRQLTQNDLAVVSPADGQVVVIEDISEPEHLGVARRKQVSVFMSPINVHINRCPIEGEVTYTHYHPGKYLVAWHPKSSTENERNTVVIKHPRGHEVLIRQIAGALARRIVWYVKPGDQVRQGSEFGFIKFGSRVDVILPMEAEIKVALGDKVLGGITVLAEV